MRDLVQEVEIPSHIYVELYATIAGELTMHVCKAEGIDMYHCNTRTDETSLTDEAQAIFNSQADYVEQMLDLCGVLKGE